MPSVVDSFYFSLYLQIAFLILSFPSCCVVNTVIWSIVKAALNIVNFGLSGASKPKDT